jgi:hypothetical protein
LASRLATTTEDTTMKHKTRRPAHCEPGSLNDALNLGERLRVSRERLADSDLAGLGQAWRLWAACADATFGYSREADQIYLTTLAKLAGVHRTKAGPLLRRFDELGVFGWQAAPRGSHGISELRLPHVAPTVHEVRHVAPTVHDAGGSCSPQGALQSNDSMSAESLSDAVSIDTGTHHSSSSLIGASEGLGVEKLGSLPDPSETGTPGEVGPARCTTPGCQGAAFSEGLCMECDRERFYAAERFAPFHGDERTGDTTPDDEASQLRWQGANPAKARARRQRD